MNPCNSIRHSCILFAVLASIPCLCAAQALAAEPVVHGVRAATNGPSITVRYADLDLSRAAGAQTLYQRINGAARSVCGDQGRRIEEQHQWKSCYRGAIADAIVKVNSPLLTLLHSGQNGEAPATARLNR
jgi:UrcA family protein